MHTERPSYTNHHLLPVVIQPHEERRLAHVHVVRGVDDLDVSDVPQLLQDGVIALAAVVLDDLRRGRLLTREAAAGEVGTDVADAHRGGHDVDRPAVHQDGVVRVVDDRLEEFQIGVFM